MADEFPYALRNAAGNRVEQRFVESSCDYNAQRPVGRRETFAIDRRAKIASEATEDAEFGVASPESRSWQQLARPQRQARSERIADSADSASPCCAQHRSQNFGEQVRMFVSVEVGDSNSCRLNLADLRSGFGSNLIGVDASRDGPRSERHESIAEL